MDNTMTVMKKIVIALWYVERYFLVKTLFIAHKIAVINAKMLGKFN